MTKVPVFEPHIRVDTMKHLMDAFDVGWLGMGATTLEFEERIGRYLGLDGRYALATNTGTSALHLALMMAGVGPGDEVITPSFNYVSDHQSIRAVGADVVFCDIRESDRGIDCAEAERLITPRTKAIMPLHFAGIPCDQAGVYALARKHGLRVIEDATHAFGTEICGKKIGSYGDLAAYSFDPVKIITSIDGGCVVTGSEREFEDAKNYRLLGVDQDTTERYKNQRAWDYDVVSPGFRYHLTNIFASVGVSQIKRVDEFIASRQAICRRYNAAFAALPGVIVPATDFSGISPFIYSLRVPAQRRTPFIDSMRAASIDVGIHFIPAHKFTYFKDSRRGTMDVTDRIVEEVVTLPLHSNMRPDWIERVIEAVTSFFGAA